MSISPIHPTPGHTPASGAPASASGPAPASSPTPTSGSSTPAGDHATISPEGRTALASEHAGQTAPPAKVLSSADAASLGRQLQHANPAHFKLADTNGDGRLSPAEAKSAGLSP
jgi:hypothetical protein